MTEPNREHEEMRERLARIEANQAHLGKQLDLMIRQGEKMVHLLDRLVRVEEHISEQQRDTVRLYRRLEKVEAEAETWRSARRIVGWISAMIGTATAVAAAVYSFGKNG